MVFTGKVRSMTLTCVRTIPAFAARATAGKGVWGACSNTSNAAVSATAPAQLLSSGTTHVTDPRAADTVFGLDGVTWPVGI
jgi:hypothetical protein